MCMNVHSNIIYIAIYIYIHFFIYLGYVLRRKFAEPLYNSIFNFLRNFQTISKSLPPSTFTNKCSRILISSFVIVCLFDYNLPGRYEVGSHCHLHLYFLNGR